MRSHFSFPASSFIRLSDRDTAQRFPAAVILAESAKRLSAAGLGVVWGQFPWLGLGGPTFSHELCKMNVERSKDSPSGLQQLTLSCKEAKWTGGGCRKSRSGKRNLPWSKSQNSAANYWHSAMEQPITGGKLACLSAAGDNLLHRGVHQWNGILADRIPLCNELRVWPLW